MDTDTQNRSEERIRKRSDEVEAIYEKMLAEAEELEKKKKEIVENYVEKHEQKNFLKSKPYR
jgi:hypothetical protein